MRLSRNFAAVGLAGALLGSGVALAGNGGPGTSGLGDDFFPLAGNGGYEVEHYDVELSYRRSGKVRVAERIEAVAGPAGLPSFHLDYRGPNPKRVKVEGQNVDVERQGQELILDPSPDIAPNAPFEVDLAYSGRPKQVTDPDGAREGWTRTKDGAVALSEPQGTPSWLAVNDHPQDKATWRLELTTPKALHGITNGKLASNRVKRGKRTTIWNVNQPMASYLALIGIGRYRIDRGKVAGIPYLAAVDRTFSAKTSMNLRKRTAHAHRCLKKFAGPYPFDATGGIVDPSSLGFALETQTRSYYPGPPSLDLVVHEVAHQWFGDSVSVSFWKEIWLNEGFAQYSEWICEERAGGPPTKRTFKRIYKDNPGDSFWNPPPYALPGPERLFANTVYVRAGMALEVLRQEIGDADFFAIVKRWTAENANGDADTDDFRALIADETAAPVPPLFEQWLTEPGRPPAP